MNEQQNAVVGKAAWLRGAAEITACFPDTLRRGICN